MGQCGFCFGRHISQCFACFGRRFAQHLDSSGDLEVIPCTVCDGTGRMPCQYCRTAGADGPEIVSAAFCVPSAPAHDPLAGRWKGADGSSWLFTRAGRNYAVRETTASGDLAEGCATLERGLVKLEVASGSIGKTRCELQLAGDTLEGTMRFLGLPAPLTLNRSYNDR